MRTEARLLAGFDHENIVQVFLYGETADKPPIPYYVMERLRGFTLARALRRLQAKGGFLPLPRSFAIMAGLLSALAYAHQRGVIHRDVKPENIFLHQKGDGSICVKLLDFGVVRIVGEARSTSGGFVGTLGAAAPEQL